MTIILELLHSYCIYFKHGASTEKENNTVKIMLIVLAKISKSILYKKVHICLYNLLSVYQYFVYS